MWTVEKKETGKREWGREKDRQTHALTAAFLTSPLVSSMSLRTISIVLISFTSSIWNEARTVSLERSVRAMKLEEHGGGNAT